MAYSLATCAAAAAGDVDISNTDDSDEHDWPSLIRSCSRASNKQITGNKMASKVHYACNNELLPARFSNVAILRVN